MLKVYMELPRELVEMKGWHRGLGQTHEKV